MANGKQRMEDLEIAAQNRFGPNAPSIIQSPTGKFQEKERGWGEWDDDEGLAKNFLYGLSDWGDTIGAAPGWINEQLFGKIPGQAWNEQWEPGMFTVEGNARDQPGGGWSPEWSAMWQAIGEDRYAEAEEEGRQQRIQDFIDAGGVPGEGGPEEPEEDIYAGLLDMYDQLHAQDTGHARQYNQMLLDWMEAEEPERAAQIRADEATILTQIDDDYKFQEERDKESNLLQEAEFQNAILSMDSQQQAADARLGTWGIDPARWTAGAGAETAALLTSQALSGARYANEMGAISLQAAGLAKARVRQGMSRELRNLANTISTMGLQANLQLQTNLQSIDRELMNNRIGVEQASVAIQQLNSQAEGAADRQMMAFLQMQNATGTPAATWMAADELGFGGDLFGRTPLLGTHADTMRPLGVQQGNVWGNQWDIPFDDIDEMQAVADFLTQYQDD